MRAMSFHLILTFFHDLTEIQLLKMADVLQTTFQSHFLDNRQEILYFDSDLTEEYS